MRIGWYSQFEVEVEAEGRSHPEGSIGMAFPSRMVVYFRFIALEMCKVWDRPDGGVWHIYRDARIPGNMTRTSIILDERELHIPKDVHFGFCQSSSKQ